MALVARPRVAGVAQRGAGQVVGAPVEGGVTVADPKRSAPLLGGDLAAAAPGQPEAGDRERLGHGHGPVGGGEDLRGDDRQAEEEEGEREHGGGPLECWKLTA